MPVKVKICCISSKEDVRIALDAGVDALGFVSRMPSGPGIISDEAIRELASFAPETVLKFLLSSMTEPNQIIEQLQFCKTNAVQLVNYVKPDLVPSLKLALTDIHIMNVVHVTDVDALNTARLYEPVSDAILLDSGNPAAQIKTLGGTGKVHDWGISEAIVKVLRVPVWLAGGLTPANVKPAIEKVKPQGIDICSGVRTNGRLDKQKLHDFLSVIRATEKQGAYLN